MRILVTGAGGFVGRHACEALTPGHEVITADRLPGHHHELDLVDHGAVFDLIQTVKPDAILHLAGMAFVPHVDANPRLGFDVNVGGVLSLLQACLHHSPSTRVLVVSSAEVYGPRRSEAPISEDDRLNPGNLYAVSKSAADLATLEFARKNGFHAMTARPQNHIGPGQSPLFVTSSFAEEIVRQAQTGDLTPFGRGNLVSTRNFTDVRDVVRAYRLILERGEAAHAYNIASPLARPIVDVLKGLYAIANIAPSHREEEGYMRPTSFTPELDTGRIRALGWTPEIPFESSLQSIYNDALVRYQSQTIQGD